MTSLSRKCNYYASLASGPRSGIHSGLGPTRGRGPVIPFKGLTRAALPRER